MAARSRLDRSSHLYCVTTAGRLSGVRHLAAVIRSAHRRRQSRSHSHSRRRPPHLKVTLALISGRAERSGRRLEKTRSSRMRGYRPPPRAAPLAARSPAAARPPQLARRGPAASVRYRRAETQRHRHKQTQTGVTRARTSSGNRERGTGRPSG